MLGLSSGYECVHTKKAKNVSMEQREFWKNEKIAFLALTTLKGVGFWTLHKIAKTKMGFKELLKSSNTKFYESFIRPQENPESSSDFQEELWDRGLSLARDLQKDNINIIFKNESTFPKKLREIPDAPLWIFVQGNLETLSKDSIAIVGTRKPSEDGMFLTKLAITSLSNSDYATVSGLALGIDQLAHNESIRYNLPTIAILGTGIRENYPRGSEFLREKIIAHGGCIVTEYLPQQSYSSENFVRRNRIQAALCDTLIPIEWKIKSGTAHTVGFASKYNKKIVNLYLPGTFNLRPELSFAKEQYNAINFEAPQEISKMLEHIASKKQITISVDNKGPQFSLNL